MSVWKGRKADSWRAHLVAMVRLKTGSHVRGDNEVKGSHAGDRSRVEAGKDKARRWSKVIA